MKTRWGTPLALSLALATTKDVAAYSIDSPISPPCHEEFAVGAFLEVLEGAPELLPEISLPVDESWKALAKSRFAPLLLEDESLRSLLEDDQTAFVAFSLLVGARKPDIDGYSITDANAFRRIHGNYEAEGQYPHCLRTRVDDYFEGDLAALAGASSLVEARVQEFAEGTLLPPAEQTVVEEFYVDHHGRVGVPVWGPGVALGEAMHTVADSFSHTIRTEDGAFVLSVLNYVDAANGTLVAERDGLPHSHAMDECRDPELGPLVRGVGENTRALLSAALALSTGDDEPLQAGLNDCPGDVPTPECGWFAYLPACRDSVSSASGAGDSSGDSAGGANGTSAVSTTCCSVESDFCDSTWLEIVEQGPSAPFCAQRPGGVAKSWAFFLGWLLALGLLVRRRRRAPSFGKARLLVLPMVVLSQGFAPVAQAEVPAHLKNGMHSGVHSDNAEPTRDGSRASARSAAEVYGAVELHGSLLSDASHGALADLSFGPALRGGYRFQQPLQGPRLGLFGVLESDLWIGMEPSFELDPGVVNLGVGVELTYASILRSSLAVGLSTLVFDTELTGAPAVGPYVELRPVGLRLPVSRALCVSLDPLGISVESPKPGQGLTMIRYRLTVGLEWYRLLPLR